MFLRVGGTVISVALLVLSCTHTRSFSLRPLLTASDADGAELPSDRWVGGSKAPNGALSFRFSFAFPFFPSQLHKFPQFSYPSWSTEGIFGSFCILNTYHIQLVTKFFKFCLLKNVLSPWSPCPA